MDYVIVSCVAVVIIYIVVMTFVQYRNIAEIKQRLKKYQGSHEKLYEEMSFEEQQLQFYAQGSLINLPSTLIASLIYKLRHRKKSA